MVALGISRISVSFHQASSNWLRREIPALVFVLAVENELDFPPVQGLWNGPSSEQFTETKTETDRVSQSCSLQVSLTEWLCPKPRELNT